MSDICKCKEFSDGETESMIFLDEALVLGRHPRPVDREADMDIEVGQCLTNVPHLVVHHSPDGFEFGYGGSGPADLALNVCQWHLNSMSYQGEKIECFDGTCWSLAWVLHQEFKRAFIENAPRQGITISMAEIKHWFATHITEDMKRMYAIQVQEDE